MSEDTKKYKTGDAERLCQKCGNRMWIQGMTWTCKNCGDERSYDDEDKKCCWDCANRVAVQWDCVKNRIPSDDLDANILCPDFKEITEESIGLSKKQLLFGMQEATTDLIKAQKKLHRSEQLIKSAVELIEKKKKGIVPMPFNEESNRGRIIGLGEALEIIEQLKKDVGLESELETE